MIADHLTDIAQFDADLWRMADDLRANSGLASNEYFLPITGLLFLRQATNRYYEARAAIATDRAAGRMPDRPLIAADFTRRRAMMLPAAVRYDRILDQPKDGKLGAALTAAMVAVEAHFPPLAGQLPKDYERFDEALPESMMRKIDTDALRTASGLAEVDATSDVLRRAHNPRATTKVHYTIRGTARAQRFPELWQ